jgi:hypothetical protein
MSAERLAFILSLCLCIHGFAHAGEGAAHIWVFDEGGGSQAFDAVDDRSGTVFGARWVPGRIGTALQFDGSDDYVALPDNNPVWLPVNDFSVCFWVYFERDLRGSVYDSEVLVDLNHASSSDPANELGYQVQRRGDTGRISFQMTTLAESDEDLYSQAIPVKGRWCHIAAVRHATMQELYIDGELDNWRVCSSTPIDFVGGYDDDKVNVGRFTNTEGLPRYHLKGMMDELMLFDRALSPEEVRQLYLAGTVLGNWYVNGAKGNDGNDGLTPRSAFATIQRAIQAAGDGDMVNVHPGVYHEGIQFLGKAITVQSIGDAAVIEARNGFAVSFRGEGPAAVLRNFVIANSHIGIFYNYGTPTITNVTVVGNVYGVLAIGTGAGPRISNSVFWDNILDDLSGCRATYSCVQRFSPGEGNFSEDPLFVDAAHGDYHLRSVQGRYEPSRDMWVRDDVASPCIDAGDPAADFSREPEPNGGRLNVGAHGGTAYASRSELMR